MSTIISISLQKYATTIEEMEELILERCNKSSNNFTLKKFIKSDDLPPNLTKTEYDNMIMFIYACLIYQSRDRRDYSIGTDKNMSVYSEQQHIIYINFENVVPFQKLVISNFCNFKIDITKQFTNDLIKLIKSSNLLVEPEPFKGKNHSSQLVYGVPLKESANIADIIVKNL